MNPDAIIDHASKDPLMTVAVILVCAVYLIDKGWYLVKRFKGGADQFEKVQIALTEQAVNIANLTSAIHELSDSMARQHEMFAVRMTVADKAQERIERKIDTLT